MEFFIFKHFFLIKIINILLIFRKYKTLLLNNTSQNIFHLNFYTYNINISSTISQKGLNPLNIWSYNEIYTIIPFGEKKEPLYALISDKDYGFYLIEGFGTINSEYNFSYLKRNKSKILAYKTFHYASIENENFFLLNENNEEIKIENFEIVQTSRENTTRNYFLEITNINPEYKNDYNIHNITFSILGLELFPRYRYEVLDNFIVQLKKKKYIYNYFWYIKYDLNNDKEGYLSIGELPKCFNDINYYKEIKVLPYKMFLKWDFKFNEIYFIKDGNKIFLIDGKINDSSNSVNANIELNQGLIIGPIDYYDIIKEYYFNYYLNNSICFENETNIKDYFHVKFFYCDEKKFLDKDIKNFPTLFFYSSELNYTFELNYKDLFKSYDNYIYFLVVFDKYEKIWNFGKIFIKKYEFYFNHDTKMIGFCSYWNKKKKNSNNLYIIVLIVFVIFICIFIIFLKKICFFKRHVRNNEIEFEISYIKKD